MLNDAREYVFPIFAVEAQDNGVFMQSRAFLGTAFFVTKRGDAITAAHVLPDSEALEGGRRLVAVVARNGVEEVCWITHSAKLPSFDFALLHINLAETKYLPIGAPEVGAGTDIQMIGIPSHEVRNSGKEMRCLKGHVTLSAKWLELNFPIPSGMSGSPVFVGETVVAYATGAVRSEEIEEATEEIQELSNKREVIRITEVRRAIYYGIAYPLSLVNSARDPVFEGKTLLEFVSERNSEP